MQSLAKLHLHAPDRRTCARLTVALLLTLAAAGCDADPVEVAASEPLGGSVAECEALLDALPSTVIDQESRDVEPTGALAAAWGDPAIVLRCGVEAPSAFTPASPCFVANDVGWFADQSNPDMVVFTSIGRSTYVELTVPASYEHAADALIDVAAPVSRSTSELKPCV